MENEMNFPLPPGFPTADKFQPSQITTQGFSWNFHPNPGSGGANYGQAFIGANDAVVVGVDFGVASDTNANNDDNHIVTKSLGVVVVPIGFHTGARLEPESIFGAGATFQGSGTLHLV